MIDVCPHVMRCFTILVTLFNINVKDASLSSLRVLIHGVEMKRERNSCFLGIYMTTGSPFALTSTKYVRKGGFVGMFNGICLGERGWNRTIMKNKYIALVRSGFVTSFQAELS